MLILMFVDSIKYLYSPELYLMIDFNTSKHRLRKTNLFNVSFYNNNYSSAYFSPSTLVYRIIDLNIDSFYLGSNIFK